MRDRETILNEMAATDFNNVPRLRLLAEELDALETETLIHHESLAYEAWHAALCRGQVN